uniref:Protein amnionless n=1 Tax=Anopheles atroparvus TaxID=41427 RepID=A0AAG5DWJ7_ANOAO
MKGLIIQLLVVLGVHRSSGAKVWLPRIDFTLSENWQPEGYPSSGQAIVFPSKLNALVGLPLGVVTFSSIVLPQQGGLIFPEDSFWLKLVSRAASETKESVFKTPSRGAYYSGSNWGNYDEQQQRVTWSPSYKATPHVERVPCQYETVVFEIDNGMPHPVDFQYHESIEVGNIRLGRSVEGLENFQTFLSSSLGQFLFYNAEDTLIRQGKCSNAEKCPCQEERQMKAICSNVVCSKPHCLSPIQPTGHCCPLCGSVFRTNVANIPGTFNLPSFTDKLRRKIASGDVDDADVDYHVGVDRSNGENVLQLIVVDKGEYGERSSRLMESLTPFFEKQFTSGYHILHAGQPHTPLEEGQVLAFLLLSLMTTVTFFSIIYVYYYDDRILPRLRAAIHTRAFFNTPFVFARFDPHNENDGVSVDVNFPSAVQSVPVDAGETHLSVAQPSSFDNPMYEQRPKVKNVDPVTEAFDDVELLVK